MASLTLVWIKCEGLANGESIVLTPFFLGRSISSPSSPAAITVTGAGQSYFPLGTKADFSQMGGLIYLHTPDGAIFSSDDYIWDTKTVSQSTTFNIVVDPTGTRSHLEPIAYYDLKKSLVAASVR